MILPNEDDLYGYYACRKNKERNIIATTIFLKHVGNRHPLVTQEDGDYMHTVILHDTRLF